MRDVDDHTPPRQQGIDAIDLLVVNLYPFEDTLVPNSDFDELVEKIDIGGPAMLRAASKTMIF